jgi:hypothetical protein
MSPPHLSVGSTLIINRLDADHDIADFLSCLDGPVGLDDMGTREVSRWLAPAARVTSTMRAGWLVSP